MEGFVVGIAAVATVGWFLYQHGSSLIARLRTTAPVPAQANAEAVVESSEGFGLLEQGLLANDVHRKVFAGMKKFSDGFEENVKSCADIRKQLILPLGGGT